MTHAQQMKLDKLTWKFHEQRKHKQELIDHRRKMLEASHSMQVKNERDAILSRIDRLQPGPRRTFLPIRLAKLNELNR